mgnify:CR=1 FL=1
MVAFYYYTRLLFPSPRQPRSLRTAIELSEPVFKSTRQSLRTKRELNQSQVTQANSPVISPDIHQPYEEKMSKTLLVFNQSCNFRGALSFLQFFTVFYSFLQFFLQFFTVFYSFFFAVFNSFFFLSSLN